jgi:hypothetical protein
VPLTVRMTRILSVIATVAGPVAFCISIRSAVIPMTIPLTGPLPPLAARLDVVASPRAANEATTGDDARRRDLQKAHGTVLRRPSFHSLDRRGHALKRGGLVPESFLRRWTPATGQAKGR